MARAIVEAGAVVRHRPTRSPAPRSTSSSSRANPTGPIHIGGARWAAVGDSLARIFAAARCRRDPRVLLQRPRRADRPVLARRCCAAARGSSRPEDGYVGAYIDEIADQVVAGTPRRARPARRRGAGGLPPRGRRADVRARSSSRCTTSASTSTSTSTSSRCTTAVPSSGRSPGCTEMGNTYEADGAIWLRTEQYGDDKDRVIVRSERLARLHLRRPAPTTSTSASAASTAS